MNPGEIRTAQQFTRHLNALHAAAVRLGFSTMVTSPLRVAAHHAETEIAQAICPHERRDTTLLSCAQIRASAVRCLDCSKTLLLEDE